MANYTVTTFEDQNNGLNTGDVSLREAILAANTQPGADTIQFASSFEEGTIRLDKGQLDIADPLTIEGLGRNQLTIEATNSESRIFKINDGDGSSQSNVTLRGMTLTGGTVTGGDSNGLGGAIFNRENLTIDSSIILGNTANDGGGIHNARTGTLTLTSSKVSGNSAVGVDNFDDKVYGGGIYSYDATLNINKSTISGNTASSYGGGLNAVLGTVTIRNSNVSGNSAANDGGGLQNSQGTMVVRQSKISNNSVSSDGGGIDNYSGDLIVSRSTLAGNSAGYGGGIINDAGNAVVSNATISNNFAYEFGDGGSGVANNSSLVLASSTISGNETVEEGGVRNSGDLTLANSIIADTPGSEDFYGDEPTTKGGNLVEDGSITGSSVINATPNLSSLQDNGGPTPTQVPQSVSLNAGNNTFLQESELGADLNADLDTNDELTTDQRGDGFSRVVGSRVDLGAVERQAQPTTFTLDVDGNGSADALTDGILAVRYLFGFGGADLTAGALGNGASRTEPAQLTSFLNDAGDTLDIDGNGSTDALTDGILLTRFLFGFSGQTLTQGAVGEGASRSSPDAIASYLEQFQPSGSSALQAQDLSAQIPELAPQTGGSQLAQSGQASTQSLGTEHSLQPEQAQPSDGLTASA